MRARVPVLAVVLALAAPAAGRAGGVAEVDSLYAAWRPLLAAALDAGCGEDPADLYKFVYQGTLGPAHAVPEDGAAAKAWLDEEWRGMTAEAGARRAPDWPLLEPLRPDSQLVRVHLAPLATLVLRGVPAEGREQVLAGAWERLALAFARTARDWRGEVGELRSVWERAAADEALWSGRPAAPRVAEFTAGIARDGWPAVHHGEAFARARRPHYRVVARALLPPSWLAAAREGAL